MPGARVTNAIKRQVRERARYCCEYCLSQEPYSPVSFSIEHIIPKIQSGASNLQNLALACQACNNYKFTSTRSIDPATGRQVELFHPRNHHWADHFQWSADFTFMLGISPTGRATIARLNLNRKSVVSFRAILVQFGKHPPY